MIPEVLPGGMQGFACLFFGLCPPDNIIHVSDIVSDALFLYHIPVQRIEKKVGQMLGGQGTNGQSSAVGLGIGCNDPMKEIKATPLQFFSHQYHEAIMVATVEKAQHIDFDTPGVSPQTTLDGLDRRRISLSDTTGKGGGDQDTIKYGPHVQHHCLVYDPVLKNSRMDSSFLRVMHYKFNVSSVRSFSVKKVRTQPAHVSLKGIEECLNRIPVFLAFRGQACCDGHGLKIGDCFNVDSRSLHWRRSYPLRLWPHSSP